MKTKTKKTKSAPKKVNSAATTIAFVLDRSGSMEATKGETISGFNHYIKTLKEDKNSSRARFTMVQFDSEGIDTLYDKAEMGRVKPLSNDTFLPRSMTPLYDAVGSTINRIIKAQEKKDNVLFAILTDGQENASHAYDYNAIKRLMKECEDDHGWTFAFIGVGAQGWNAVQHISVGTRSASNAIHIDPKDIKKSYRKMSRSTVSYCSVAANTSGLVGTVSNFWDDKAS